jgi:hypothetical protein
MTSNSVVGSGYGRVAMLFAMLLRCVVATHRRNSTSATTIGCVNQVATLQSIEMGNPTYLRRCKATCDGERWVLCNSLHDAMGKMRSNKDAKQVASHHGEPNRNPTATSIVGTRPLLCIVLSKYSIAHASTSYLTSTFFYEVPTTLQSIDVLCNVAVSLQCWTSLSRSTDLIPTSLTRSTD